MGWDVFISHASEDKPTVAVPLKQALEQLGISVWIDLEQIKLGDSFRSRIDGGLQLCRFGVVILSPRFFQKPWAKAELDALLNMEMSVSGDKRLLPIICDMSFEELGKQSPLLAARRAINWSAGVKKVAEAIAEVILGVTAPSATLPQPPVVHRAGAVDSLILFLLKDGRMAYAETTEIESRTDGLDVTIKCVDLADTALVQEFGRNRSDLVAVAFGTTAMLGRVTDATLKKSGAGQVGVLRLRNERTHGGNMMEMSFNGISADQFAEMRAKRILLNEQLPHKSGQSLDSINQSMLDHFVAGQDGFIKVAESPILKLYRQFSAQPPLFLSLARLAAVIFLCLSDAVESILRLDLILEGSSLKVEFSGRRSRRFTNVEPSAISVKGTLALLK